MTDQNNKRRREQGGRLEDRLTSLHDDLLIFILSFLSIKQRVALSAVCARFRLLQPSIPRLDAFRLEVRFPSDGVDVHKDLTIPRALIRQFHLDFHFVADLLIPHENQLVDALVDTGVQNLTLEASGNGFLYLSDRENCCIFNIKSLRSLILNRSCFRVSKYSDRRPLSPLGCAFLTILEMKFSVVSDDFLCNLLASCPFLETLHLFRCYLRQHGMDKISFHSAPIKRLILFQIHMLPSIFTIDVRAPQLELLIMDVVTTIRIEAPKVRNASLLLSLKSRQIL
ncbi:uncharacterized protein LOC121968205 [Zingiber officinale]|uniref:uncharacterized protein LOC121968205 n=1 Tax=Zingiber officinale TaxID=94328 RepID=UPI001C4A7A08|nr:uncharacterized protein LOC121968205 [Zingiber officinale]